MIVPLDEPAAVTLDGSGNGTCRVGPRHLGQKWYPEVAAVKISSAVKNATCKVYVGPAVNDQYFVDNTYLGSTGDATAKVRTRGNRITQGLYVWAVFTGGDVGATATLSVMGTMEIGGQR